MTLNHAEYMPTHSIRFSKFIVYIFLFLVILNNLLYQTDFQFNQIFFVFVLAVLSFTLKFKFIEKRLLFLVVGLSVVYFFEMVVSDSSEDLNRAIFYLCSALLYANIVFRGHMLMPGTGVVFGYFFVFLVVAVLIILFDNRIFVNPNWVAITLFFLLAVSSINNKAIISVVLFVGLIVSFFVYQSRGSSVVYATSLLALSCQGILGDRFSRKAYVCAFLIALITFVSFLGVLQQGPEELSSYVSNYSERGLGGREYALIRGLSDLKESGYLGYGPSTSGGYFNNLTDQAVHIHFGFLDIALKFSIFAVVALIVFLAKVVFQCSARDFPMIAGGFMTVFFYNGFAQSHFGLNVFLFILVSRALFLGLEKKEIFKYA